MNWISVKERLPADCEMVIFYMNPEEGDLRDHMLRGDGPIFVGSLEGHNSIGCAYGDGWVPFGREDISHWMPLPAPPERKT